MSSLPTSICSVTHDERPRQGSLTFPPAPVYQRQSSSNPQIMEDCGAMKDKDETEDTKPSVFGTRKKKVILFSISLYWFTVNCAYAMIAPFFPGEAAAKGSNKTITGFIFACFPLVMFIFSPVVGVLLPIVGPKQTLMMGLFVEGGAQVLFGFLDLMPNGHIFIIFCFLVRTVSALGASATSIASLTFLVQNFHENISPAMGVMETFGGFGMMAGPPIGGFLYSAGGFKMPFLVLGSIIIFSLLPIFWVLPSDNEEKSDEGANKGALWQLIKIPAVLIIAIITAVGAMALSFLDPTLQGHLQKPFHLNSSQIGLMFLIGPGIYAILAPLVGYISDKMDTRVVMVIGGVIVSLCYILLGPSPFLPDSVFPRTLWLNGIALALLGIGVGPYLIPGLSDMTSSATGYGMSGDLSTHSAISSLFNAMFSIGSIAGPTLGGFLAQHIGFPWASAIFGFFILLWTLILVIFTVIERKMANGRNIATPEETKPLLA